MTFFFLLGFWPVRGPAPGAPHLDPRLAGPWVHPPKPPWDPKKLVSWSKFDGVEANIYKVGSKSRFCASKTTFEHSRVVFQKNILKISEKCPKIGCTQPGGGSPRGFLYCPTLGGLSFTIGCFFRFRAGLFFAKKRLKSLF